MKIRTVIVLEKVHSYISPCISDIIFKLDYIYQNDKCTKNTPRLCTHLKVMGRRSKNQKYPDWAEVNGGGKTEKYKYVKTSKCGSKTKKQKNSETKLQRDNVETNRGRKEKQVLPQQMTCNCLEIGIQLYVHCDADGLVLSLTHHFWCSFADSGRKANLKKKNTENKEKNYQLLKSQCSKERYIRGYIINHHRILSV